MNAEKQKLDVVVWALLAIGIVSLVAGIAVHPLFLLPTFPVVGLALKIIDIRETKANLGASHV